MIRWAWLLGFLIACGSPAVTKGDEVAEDPAVDAPAAPEAEAKVRDAGQPPVVVTDAGVPDVVNGTNDGSATVPVDAAQPPVDAATPPVDAGPAPVTIRCRNTSGSLDVTATYPPTGNPMFSDPNVFDFEWQEIAMGDYRTGPGKCDYGHRCKVMYVNGTYFTGTCQ